ADEDGGIAELLEQLFHYECGVRALIALAPTSMRRGISALTSNSEGWVRILSTHRHGAEGRAGDVEIEREVLVDGLRVAQIPLQRGARGDSVRAVAGPERLHRLSRRRNRQGVLDPKA